MDKKIKEMAREEIQRMVWRETRWIRRKMGVMRWDLNELKQRMRAWARGSAPLRGENRN
jgi:hypothetical protein